MEKQGHQSWGSSRIALALVAGAGLVMVLAVLAPRLGHRTGGGIVGSEGNLPVALSRAGSENKLVMVDFYTDWCGWCKKLDSTTLADPDVQRALSGFVVVKLNAEKGGLSDAKRFGVDAFPTIVFLDATGAEVGRIPGYMDPKPFLDELNDVLKRKA